MKKGLCILFTLLAVYLLLPSYGFADTVTLAPYADAMVATNVAHSEPYSNWNYGGGANLLVNVLTATNGSFVSERRSYLKFDLTGLAGINPADVSSVELTLYFTQIPDLGGTIYAYHSPDNYAPSADLSGSWLEGDGIGQTNASLIAAGKTPGITGNNQPLDYTVGNKPVSGLIGILTLGAGLLGGYHTIAFANDGWLAGDLSDGFLSVALYDAIPSATAGAYYICSKDANPAVCHGPSLEIQYSAPVGAPEPTTMLLLGLGLVGLAGVRRKFQK